MAVYQNSLNLVDILPLVTVFMLTLMFFFILNQMRSLTKLLTERAVQPHQDTAGYEQVMMELRAMVQDRKDGEQLRQTNIDIANVLSAKDRIQLARLVALMNVLDAKISEAATHAEGVAEDLAASHDRANQTEGPSGAAADAAFKTTQL